MIIRSGWLKVKYNTFEKKEERFSFFEKTVRLDYQPLFGKELALLEQG